MKALTGDEIRRAVCGKWLSRKKRVPLTGVSIDSRTARQDDLFVAIRGEKHDGHDYLADAVEKGCLAAIVDSRHDISEELLKGFYTGVIVVEDTREALLDLGGYYRSVMSATLVAVTGSNGKTTVKNMIDHVLSKRYEGTSGAESYNNEIGLPLTILSAGGTGDYVVCEIGTSNPGEINRLSGVARPDIGVITSIAPSHVEGLGTVESIAAEKGSMMGWLGNDKTGIVCADNPELNRVLQGCETKLISFGISRDADLRLTDYRRESWGQLFLINDYLPVRLGIPGKHNALNAIAAIAVCARFGFSMEDAAEILSDYRLPPMRLERQCLDSIQLINDSYNANPGSVAAAIEVVSEDSSGRLVAVIGDMLELGDDSESLHEKIGDLVASRGFGLVVGVGDMGAVVARRAADHGIDTAVFPDASKAGRALGGLVRKGDTVLIKGSRAMKLESLVSGVEKIAKSFKK